MRRCIIVDRMNVYGYTIIYEFEVIVRVLIFWNCHCRLSSDWVNLSTYIILAMSEGYQYSREDFNAIQKVETGCEPDPVKAVGNHSVLIKSKNLL